MERAYASARDRRWRNAVASLLMALLLVGCQAVGAPEALPSAQAGKAAPSPAASATPSPEKTPAPTPEPTMTLDLDGYFAAGDGSAENPYYIATAAQLDHVRGALNAHYRLACDIDLSAWENFTPIGAGGYAGGGVWAAEEGFAGVFDGNGYRIYGIELAVEAQCGGLFATIGETGEVRNLTVEGAISSGKADDNKALGLLAGYNAGTIEGCAAGGSVEAQGKYAMTGGLVGANDGVMLACANAAAVTAAGEYGKTGGITGLSLPGGTLEACANAGTIEGEYSAGGIAGWNEGQAGNCANSGTIRAGHQAGGVFALSFTKVEGCESTGAVAAPRKADVCTYAEGS